MYKVDNNNGGYHMSIRMFQTTLLVFSGMLLQPGLSSGGYEMPFGCQAMTMNDTTRQGALNLINRIRSSVALGEFQAQEYLPSASNMDKLRWDCNLETMAQTAVQNCPQNPPPPSVANSMNYLVFGAGTPQSNPIELAVLEWAEISSSNWPPNNIYNGNPALLYFSNLIRATTAAVGCSSTMCGNRTAAACVFSQPNVQVGTVVYLTGNPCRNDMDCTRFSPAFCEFGLCVNAARRNATTTTTTTTPTTTTRRRSTDCPSTESSAPFRETALGLHNNFRSLVARGLVVNAEHPNELAPPASQMDLLEYDCNAELYAINHVKSCDRQVLPPASRPGYQENIHILETTATTPLGAIQNAVLTWSNELTVNGIPSNMIFTAALAQRQTRTATSITKVVWGTNKKVGCASQACHGFYFTSCLYPNPVNVIGQNIYTIGAVCSTCPTGLNNCDVNVGLCSY